MSLSLLIDSSIHGIFLAILSYPKDSNDVSVVYKNFWDKYDGSVGAISLFLKEALTTINFCNSDIDKIFISTGPGSFTGIKIGLSFCYGFVQALKSQKIPVNVIGFSSIKVLLRELQLSEKAPCIVLKATKAEGYYAISNDANEIEVNILDLKTFSNNINFYNKYNVFIINKWQEFEYMLKSLGTVQFNILEYQSCNELILRHMIMYIKNFDRIKQTNDYMWAQPKPLYLRNPAIFGKR